MRDATEAVAYLHNRKPAIIHRDIKPENMLLCGKKGEEVLKLADFGWSNMKDGMRETYCGTPDYLSPEMIKGGSHGEGIDVWALGVLAYELLVGRAPFTPKNSEVKSRRDKLKKMEMNIMVRLRLILDFEVSNSCRTFWSGQGIH
jgi:serine/threonine protein kinase